MALWSGAPPEPRSRNSNTPTLLFSWWCTIFSAVLILIRISGRKVRLNAFLMEDKVMFLSLIPLFIRMGLVHVVLLYGTNNVETQGLTPQQIHDRATGSQLVLASRIFYAMFIWMSKFTVSEFLKRTFYNTWRQSYEYVLHCIRIFLVVTFVAVVIATLAECQPFSHYWQVVPDPGPQCRQGFAQLITMGAADITTDILLVLFPIPVVLSAPVGKLRKVFLVMLFSINLILVGVTGSRVPKVIEMRGRQQYRTVWASIEILASTFVSNAVIVGSFVRDTGVKKNKFRKQSITDSIERAPTRRMTVPFVSNSDEDLFRSIGCRIPPELQEEVEEYPIPAKPVFTDLDTDEDIEKGDASPRSSRWDRSPQAQSSHFSDDRRNERGGTADLAAFLRSTSPPSSPPSRKVPRSPTDMIISDVGGLLGDSPRSPHAISPEPPESSNGTLVQDFASGHRPSRSLLSDIGGLLGRSASGRRSQQRRGGRSRSRSRSRSREAREDRRVRQLQDHGFESNATTPVNNAGASSADSIELEDVGGLLK